MDNDDEFDTEALQAQIDLSMSFAQDLVSSWVKPNRKLANKDSADIETELKEYMRRPPRLGVGAPIPEPQTFYVEGARLRGKLVGKGHRKQAKDDALDREEEKSDDEGESRAGAIKKKRRLDPFEAEKPKKRKKSKALQNGEGTSVSKNDDTSQRKIVEVYSEGNAPAAKPNPFVLDSSADRTRKKDEGQHHTPPQRFMRPVDSVTSTKGQTDLTSIPDTPKAKAFPSLPLPFHSPKSERLPPRLKQPILNLSRPMEREDEGNESDHRSSSPTKKKRKRRRKKKGALTEGEHGKAP